MSRASKITLVTTTIFSVLTIGGVYYVAESEKDALQDGPIKDKERLDRRFNAKQQENLDDFERQKLLKKQLEADQPLSGEIIQGIDQGKNQ